MEYRKFNNTIIARIDKGEEILEKIKEADAYIGIRSANPKELAGISKQSMEIYNKFYQTPEFGGGEIYFDDVLIRKDGRFVLEELKPLNPENLI